MINGDHSSKNQDDTVKLLSGSVEDKIQYLKMFQDAINKHSIRKIYQLIDSKKYYNEILNQNGKSEHYEDNEKLINDLKPQISNFLSKYLINYLNHIYPFFYFEEIYPGNFQFYFGNWWGRKLFGKLDVINVKLHFNQVEYDKLAKSFSLEIYNKRLNSDYIEKISKENDRLQSLIDTQNDRDIEKKEIRMNIRKLSQEKVMPWENSKIKSSKQKLKDKFSQLTELDEQANNAYKTIHKNEEMILSLSKEDTLIDYEKQSIVAKFGTFENFESKNKTLYRDYIASLIVNKE